MSEPWWAHCTAKQIMMEAVIIAKYLKGGQAERFLLWSYDLIYVYAATETFADLEEVGEIVARV